MNENPKACFISELQPDSAITSAFLVLQKDVRQKKDGDPYLSLILGDHSGQIEAKMWDGAAEAAATFDRDDVIKVRAAARLYRDKLQLTIEKVRKLEPAEVRLEDYLPSSSADLAALWLALQQRIAAMTNPHLRALLQAIFGDASIATRYQRAPAAKALHHAYLGGLLEHVSSLCRLAELVAQNYPYLDRDLLLTGILLHDVGKIEELDYARSFSYTTRGQLLGHIIMALEIVHQKLAGLPDFPRNLQTLVEHLIISHHGQYDFGSPKLPMFPEALMLHQLDDMDSKMQAMRTQLQQEPPLTSAWTAYNRSLDRPLLRTALWLDDAPAPADASARSESA